MKNNLRITLQKVCVYLSVAIAMTIFIMGLGFMTNLHRLFFDGTYEMYEYYKSVQVLNRSMFSIGIMYVIYAFLLLPFDINKGLPGIFGTTLVSIGTIITVMKSFTMFKYIPYFQDKYEAFDFSVVENYVASPWQFDLAIVLFAVWDVIAVSLLVLVIMNFIKYVKSHNKDQEVRGARYES